jgi:hypothetical protein
MGKIIPLGNITRLDLPPDRVLEAAKGKLDGVLLIGFEKDTGEVYAASSYADGGAVMWLLESCKQQLFDADAE